LVLEFQSEMAQIKLSLTEKENVGQRCYRFVKSLLKQMIDRLPLNMEIFKKYKLLSPSSCVSQKQEKFANLPVRMYLDPSVSIDTYETQWRKLYFVNWQEKFEEKEIPNCSTKFW
jgi:hypothetical protein